MTSSNGSNARIRREVRDHILAEYLPGADANELTDETPLITGGILDSISTVMLVTFLEGQYGVEFRSHEVDPEFLDTIELIAGTIEAKRS